MSASEAESLDGFTAGGDEARSTVDDDGQELEMCNAEWQRVRIKYTECKVGVESPAVAFRDTPDENGRSLLKHVWKKFQRAIYFE